VLSNDYLFFANFFSQATEHAQHFLHTVIYKQRKKLFADFMSNCIFCGFIHISGKISSEIEKSISNAGMANYYLSHANKFGEFSQSERYKLSQFIIFSELTLGLCYIFYF